MKLALAQMSMQESMESNLKKSEEFCDLAEGSDLLFFPEIQLSPFFPQYSGWDVSRYCLKENADEIFRLKRKAAEHHYYFSPNLYMEKQGKRYDTSLWISPDGELLDTAEMVHIAQAEKFYEQDYYAPSESGFKVFDTPFGRVGIVICYDRHLPESIRTCVLGGADLILIPTANTKAEPMEMFEWEIRVQAMQNQVFIAMCNRVGKEGEMEFSGESLVVHPSGDVILKADDKERLLTCEIDLKEAREWREKVPYLHTRRPEWYKRFFGQKKEGVRSMCDVAERLEKMGWEKGIEQGIEQGSIRNSIKVYKNLLNLGFGKEEARKIAEVPENLDEKEIRRLAEQSEDILNLQPPIQCDKM